MAREDAVPRPRLRTPGWLPGRVVVDAARELAEVHRGVEGSQLAARERVPLLAVTPPGGVCEHRLGWVGVLPRLVEAKGDVEEGGRVRQAGGPAGVSGI